MVKSLRWRIQFWHGVILAVVVTIFGTLTYLQQRQSRTVVIHNELKSAAEVLVGQLQAASPTTLNAMLHRETGTEPKEHELAWENAAQLFENLTVPRTFAPRRYRHDFEQPYFVIWNASGQLVKASESAPSIPYPEIDAALLQQDPRPIFSPGDSFQELKAAGPSSTIVLVGRDVRADFRDLRSILYTVIVSGICVFLLGLIGGWILSGRSVQPIEEISRVASQISEHNLSRRIEIGETDTEFATLAQTLNDAFSRLQTAFERQLQFTADASHELRTPLSVVQIHQELALSKERTPEEYREAIETCQRATTRMNALIESLLTLARLDSGRSNLSKQPIDVPELVKECVQQVSPIADAKNVGLSIETTSAFVDGDADQLTQVMINLLSNAIAYSPSDAAVIVSIAVTNDRVKIGVSDQGIGIPEQDLPHVFERFYRVDKQRSRDSGGSGLGLAICKTIVEAHGGVITAESAQGEGATFRIHLPCYSKA